MSSVLDFELKHKIKPQKAILLFHGMTGSPFEMRKYAKHLHSCGFDVFCYCLAGHGEDMKNIFNMKAQDWINNANSQYESLKDEYKYFFLSGLCLGAVIALNLAQKHKDVSGVIALSTTLFLDGWRLPWYRIFMPIAIFTILRFYFTLSESEPYGIKCEKTRAKIIKIISKSSDNGFAMDNYPLTCVYELLCLSEKTRKQIHKVDTPVLLVHSKEDDLTSLKSANFVYKNIRSIQKELVILNNSYHMVLYDNEKDLVFQKSIEFMEKIIETGLKSVSFITSGAHKKDNLRNEKRL